MPEYKNSNSQASNFNCLIIGGRGIWVKLLAKGWGMVINLYMKLRNCYPLHVTTDIWGHLVKEWNRFYTVKNCDLSG